MSKGTLFQREALMAVRATDPHRGKKANLAPAVESTAHAAFSGISSLSTAEKKDHRSAESRFSFLLTPRKQSILQSLSSESSLPAGIFIDIQNILNKQGVRRGAINAPAMGRQWVDAKKTCLVPEVFFDQQSCYGNFCFSFFVKWRVIKEVQTMSENDSKTRSAPAEQQLSLGGITGLGKFSLYLNPGSCNFLSAVYCCHGR